jgi:hypothetical protein
MKTFKNKFFTLALLLLGFQSYAAFTYAAATVSGDDVLIYIAPVEYSNPIRVSSYFRDYWYNQGPMVEPMVLAKISQAYGKTAFCDAKQSGKMLVWVKPEMFYNPQLQRFYGSATIQVYTGLGKHVGNYEGESSVRGYMDIKPQRWIEQSYALAIDDAVIKMQADAELQRVFAEAATVSAESTPCSMISLLPTTRIRAMSF